MSVGVRTGRRRWARHAKAMPTHLSPLSPSPAALPVRDVRAQRARGAGDRWSVGDVEPFRDLLENLRRRHKNGDTRVQQARVSARRGSCWRVKWGKAAGLPKWAEIPLGCPQPVGAPGTGGFAGYG